MPDVVRQSLLSLYTAHGTLIWHCSTNRVDASGPMALFLSNSLHNDTRCCRLSQPPRVLRMSGSSRS